MRLSWPKREASYLSQARRRITRCCAESGAGIGTRQERGARGRGSCHVRSAVLTAPRAYGGRRSVGRTPNEAGARPSGIATCEMAPPLNFRAGEGFSAQLIVMLG